MPARRATPLTVGLLAKWCGVKHPLSGAGAAQVVNNVWNDSRKVEKGDAFVALKTDSDDGHKYVAGAIAQGAVAAIVSRESASQFSESLRRKLLVVNDPLTALQRCGAAYRKELGLLLIGITGSSGKTTTRSFLTHVLSSAMDVGATFGNWNNHIGVPLSILRFTGDEYAAVIEMGANHTGEIRALSMIAQPDIGIITNIGYSHVGLFGSIAKTAKAKLEIVEGLNKRKGFLLLNGDDSRLVRAARTLDVKTVFFGLSKNCQIRARILSAGISGTTFSVDADTYHLPMPGRHFVYAALPAIGLGLRLGLSPEMVAKALAGLEPVAMRGAITSKKKVRFVLDCYNANPSSMHAGLGLLTDVAPADKRIAVVGDMLELGRYSTDLHCRLGADLAAAQVREAIIVGQFATDVAAGARNAGMKGSRIHPVANSKDAVSLLRGIARPGDTVLLKASRGVKLETVFESF